MNLWDSRRPFHADELKRSKMQDGDLCEKTPQTEGLSLQITGLWDASDSNCLLWGPGQRQALR